MATTLNVTTNFVGKEAGEYIAEMIKQANTISENLVTVLPNVVSPQWVRKIESTTGFIDYACGWAPAGSVTLSEKELAPKKIKWDSEFCKEDFRQLWTAQEMGFSAHNDNLPATEQAAILADYGQRVARKIDVDIWEGDGTTGVFAGIIPALVADVDVLDVATPVAITSANVEAELAKFIDTVPDELIGSDGYILGVSTNVLRALKKIQGSLARANGTFSNPSEFDFNGYTLTEIKGLNANTMVGYNKGQVFFGTGLLSDMNEVKIKDMDESDLSGQIRMKLVMTGGVQYAYGGEIVLYRA
ncbi:hypothetical protein [uncultured Lutibacter sp.]|uniref:hypothetical protein n=1 Tax=uncultured Lutibacter sp. TaxID=437739 RepID=UPI002608097B|nr:hypothetical protein [uncultured Lutibacter sp.]